MAHDPKIKAAAVMLFAIGQGITEVSNALKSKKVAKSTVQGWHKEWEEQSSESTFEIKQRKFAESIADFGIAAMEMLKSQAELLSDPAYLKTIGTEDAIKHTEFIRESLFSVNSTASYVEKSALPERSDAIEPEVVEE